MTWQSYLKGLQNCDFWSDLHSLNTIGGQSQLSLIEWLNRLNVRPSYHIMDLKCNVDKPRFSDSWLTDYWRYNGTTTVQMDWQESKSRQASCQWRGRNASHSVKAWGQIANIIEIESTSHCPVSFPGFSGGWIEAWFRQGNQSQQRSGFRVNTQSKMRNWFEPEKASNRASEPIACSVHRSHSRGTSWLVVRFFVEVSKANSIEIWIQASVRTSGSVLTDNFTQMLFGPENGFGWLFSILKYLSQLTWPVVSWHYESTTDRFMLLFVAVRESKSANTFPYSITQSKCLTGEKKCVEAIGNRCFVFRTCLDTKKRWKWHSTSLLLKMLLDDEKSWAR
jgi:hypothetical protein